MFTVLLAYCYVLGLNIINVWVGYDKLGLGIVSQLIALPWDEASLLHAVWLLYFEVSILIYNYGMKDPLWNPFPLSIKKKK
jgi:hypothetical protein